MGFRPPADRVCGVKGSIALVSLRFRPAFVSHLVAFAKAYEALGLEVSFLVCSEYLRFPDLEKTARVVPYSNGDALRRYTHAVFLNISQLNLHVASKLKDLGARIIYVYHEPWLSLMSYLKTDGVRRTTMTTLAHALSLRMLELADAVIVPSSYAAAVYEKGDIRHNRNFFMIPLLFDDEAISPLGDLPAKRYISYIGTICREHGFDQYVDFMRSYLSCDLGVRFRIASARALPRYVLRDPVLGRHSARIEICCGRPLQNEEINRYYSESVCVWNVYRRSMQSGVLPKAFMFGTPVLASHAGSFVEFVEDDVDGRFVCAQNHTEIGAAVDDMRNRIAEYARNCRAKFTGTFFYRSKLADLERLL